MVLGSAQGRDQMSTARSTQGHRAEWQTPPNVRLAYPSEQKDARASILAKVLALVGESKRVLTLGGDSALLEGLREQNCDTVTIPAGLGTGAGSLDEPVRHELMGKDAIDVVAVNVLEHLHNPLAVLESVKKCLRPEGQLIVAVPNVAHANVRLSLLDGRFPFGAKRAFSDAPLRFFTYESLIEMLETAQFALGVLERIEEDICVSDGTTSTASAELVTAVSQAPEARTSHFIALAHPLPRPDLSWLQSRFRILSEQYSAATHELEGLRQDFDAVNDHVRLLIELQQAANGREKELHARIESLHEEMMLRDEEYRSQTSKFQHELKRAKEDEYLLRLHIQDLSLTLPRRIYGQVRNRLARLRGK
jgi:SAM-dependent methyltransferase